MEALELHGLRLPPSSVEAEQAVLGALMLDNDAWDRCADLVSAGDFYSRLHRWIFEAIGDLLRASRPADIITVYERLDSRGKGAECGGLNYLNDLTNSIASAYGIRRYAQIVREKALERGLIAKLDEAGCIAWGGEETETKLDRVATLMRDVDLVSTNDKPTPIRDLVVQCMDQVSDRYERGGVLPGSPTGFQKLDETIGGWEKQRVYTLAARPSVGKSSIAGRFARHQALELGVPTVVFTLEMGKLQWALRLIGEVGGVNGTRLRTGKLEDGDWSRMSEAVERLAQAALHLDDRPAQTVMDIRRKARSVPKAGFIVIDYLQLMGIDVRYDTRAAQIGAVSRGTKQLAKDLDCPVLQLAQLNRKVEERADRRPMLSDLREAGDIEQDSDVIMFLRRHQVVNPEYDVIGLEVAKNRDGPLGDIALNFRKPYNQWTSSAVNLAAKPDPNMTAEGNFE